MPKQSQNCANKTSNKAKHMATGWRAGKRLIILKRRIPGTIWMPTDVNLREVIWDDEPTRQQVRGPNPVQDKGRSRKNGRRNAGALSSVRLRMRRLPYRKGKTNTKGNGT